MLKTDSHTTSLLSRSEIMRYARHFNLPDFGPEAQMRLKASRVLVVGAGGLGCPVLLYLTAVGVGHIGIVDGDKVDISNLQRQVLYSEEDIGESKARIAAVKLSLQNSDIRIEAYPFFIDESNALDLIALYDLVLDGTDNFPTRYLINDACVMLGKANVYASIFRYEGQVSVFNFPYPDGSFGPNYRDLYPEPPDPHSVPDCASGGVLGVLPGILGSLQALEAIKLITGIGEPLVSKLLLVDSLTMQFKRISLPQKSAERVDKLINYQDFCGYNNSNTDMKMREITALELKEWKDTAKDFQLIDVREQKEIDFATLGGIPIPLGDIMYRSEEIAKDKEVVIMCRSGKRSAAAVQALQQHGFDNVINLKGGYLAWVDDVDPSLPKY